jgi:hypothetical protein
MNPELQRNVWLEFSLHRLVAMPGVLALIFLCAALATQPDSDVGVTTTGLLLFTGLTGLWGGRRAADSVTEEFRGKTWDGQRMSALGPWGMTWGKLVGSTSYAWYGALMCLATVAVAWPLRWEYPASLVIAGAVCVAVGAQALALIASLMATRKGLVRSYTRGTWFVLLVLVFSGSSTPLVTTLAQSFSWWGHEVEGWRFALGTSVVFAFWAVFGAYRLMCQELQVRTTPWGWATFVLFLAWYLAGFAVQPGGSKSSAVFLIAGLLVSAALTYFMLFSEQTGALVLRRVWVRVQRQEWRRTLEEVPCWLMSLALATVFCVLLILTVSQFPGESWDYGDISFTSLPLLGLLFLIRDSAIFLVFSLARTPRRVEATTLLYLALLYLILPGVCQLASANTLGALVLPPVFEQPVFANVVLAGHAAIAVGLVVHRWRQSFKD